MYDPANVSGIGEYAVITETHNDRPRTRYEKSGITFLVVNPSTIELRTDDRLRTLLTDKYESVMQSRYFGRGGIEIVLAGAQLTADELDDLVRLSYNLS